jgi:anti-sigma regulatory factor (Ser/Thr protein kinase)
MEYYINLTIEELASNIISFGFNDGKLHYICIKIVLIEKDIYIRMRDDSISYNPFEELKDLDNEMDYLGVSIIRAKAKSFAYNRTLAFNNLLIIL